MNPNLQFLRENKDKAKILLLQGGTRSGKTYSALQFIISICYQHPKAGIIASICRKTMPSLKATAMRDFLDLLKQADFYREDDHNKTDGTYSLFGNTVEFVNLDDEQKVRGRKRNLLYVNEANEIGHEVVRQLLFRTSGISIFDYNPSIDDGHWLVSDMLARDNCKRIITTYKDNPHLSERQVEEIERLKKTNPDAWKVFGLGEIGAGMKGLVFPNWEYGFLDKGLHAFGLDFGFEPDPVALVEVRIAGGQLFVREHIYRNRMTPDEIASAVKSIVPRGVPVYCDHRPEIVEMMYRAGINAKLASKGPGSIDTGLRTIQQHAMHVAPESHNLIRELKNYTYQQDRDGNPIGGVPKPGLDHAIDAMRYAVAGIVVVPVRKPFFAPTKA